MSSRPGIVDLAIAVVMCSVSYRRVRQAFAEFAVGLLRPRGSSCFDAHPYGRLALLNDTKASDSATAGLSVPSAVMQSATIVIVTKDRRDELHAALDSATTLTGRPDVLVIDDGSSDGTSEMVQREFPSVRVVRSESSRGYIRQRNRAARLVDTPILVSIDDDAEFSTPDVVERTVAEFDDDRVAAVAIPFVHTNRDSRIRQRAPTSDGIWVTNAYIGTAHAVRRDLFLALGGYRETMEHFFEEPDFCSRLLRGGYLVRLGRASPILHHESPRRNNARQVRYVCRNHVLLLWFHVPLPHALLRAIGVAVYAAWYGTRRGAPSAALEGLLAGIRYAREHPEERSPLAVPLYRLYRRLRWRPAPLEDVARRVPASTGSRT